MSLLKQLIQISIGKKDSFDQVLTESDWQGLYAEAEKHSLVGVLFAGIERLPKDQLPPMDVLMDWLGQAEYIKTQSEKQNERTTEVSHLFAAGGLRTCILKGQGIACLYPVPALRQCGDIDVWVEGGRDIVLEFVRKNGYRVDSVVIHHADVKIFDDTETEIHFIPSYTYNPFLYRKYIQWFAKEGSVQFCHLDKIAGYTYPSLGFNAVYILLHIYRHVFNEGIGLRQLMDYFYVLDKLTDSDRINTFKTLKWFGLDKFSGSVMYIMKEVFFLEDKKLLCPIREVEGKKLLDEIYQAGNFGKYDDRVKTYSGQYSLRAVKARLGRLFRFVKEYPSEVLWAPWWKLWHTCWITFNGYNRLKR